MSLLTADGVTVRRGGKTILDDVSVSFPGGAFVAVIGANGAGKSTLLSVLAGLLRPDKGEAKLDGRPMAGLDRRELARRRAYLPQSPRCEWPIPVERLVALGLTPSLPAFGGFAADMQQRIDRALHACDLDDHRQQPATTLSGGELARAMLARALVGDPQVLIVDEPMAGLDPGHALDAVARLQGLAQGGKLVVASVHDLTLAARFSTHILALRGGRVTADGPTAATLTAQLLRHTFDVEARVSGHGRDAVVDFIAPASS
jgi:iron complex transport system ATP-binding protein